MCTGLERGDRRVDGRDQPCLLRFCGLPSASKRVSAAMEPFAFRSNSVSSHAQVLEASFVDHCPRLTGRLDPNFDRTLASISSRVKPRSKPWLLVGALADPGPSAGKATDGVSCRRSRIYAVAERLGRENRARAVV